MSDMQEETATSSPSTSSGSLEEELPSHASSSSPSKYSSFATSSSENGPEVPSIQEEELVATQEANHMKNSNNSTSSTSILNSKSSGSSIVAEKVAVASLARGTEEPEEASTVEAPHMVKRSEEKRGRSGKPAAVAGGNRTTGGIGVGVSVSVSGGQRHAYPRPWRTASAGAALAPKKRNVSQNQIQSHSQEVIGEATATVTTTPTSSGGVESSGVAAAAVASLSSSSTGMAAHASKPTGAPGTNSNYNNKTITAGNPTSGTTTTNNNNTLSTNINTSSSTQGTVRWRFGIPRAPLPQHHSSSSAAAGGAASMMMGAPRAATQPPPFSTPSPHDTQRSSSIFSLHMRGGNSGVGGGGVESKTVVSPPHANKATKTATTMTTTTAADRDRDRSDSDVTTSLRAIGDELCLLIDGYRSIVNHEKQMLLASAGHSVPATTPTPPGKGNGFSGNHSPDELNSEWLADEKNDDSENGKADTRPPPPPPPPMAQCACCGAFVPIAAAATPTTHGNEPRTSPALLSVQQPHVCRHLSATRVGEAASAPEDPQQQQQRTPPRQRTPISGGRGGDDVTEAAILNSKVNTNANAYPMAHNDTFDISVGPWKQASSALRPAGPELVKGHRHHKHDVENGENDVLRGAVASAKNGKTIERERARAVSKHGVDHAQQRSGSKPSASGQTRGTASANVLHAAAPRGAKASHHPPSSTRANANGSTAERSAGIKRPQRHAQAPPSAPKPSGKMKLKGLRVAALRTTSAEMQQNQRHHTATTPTTSGTTPPTSPPAGATAAPTSTTKVEFFSRQPSYGYGMPILQHSNSALTAESSNYGSGIAFPFSQYYATAQQHQLLGTPQYDNYRTVEPGTTTPLDGPQKAMLRVSLPPSPQQLHSQRELQHEFYRNLRRPYPSYGKTGAADPQSQSSVAAQRQADAESHMRMAFGDHVSAPPPLAPTSSGDGAAADGTSRPQAVVRPADISAVSSSPSTSYMPYSSLSETLKHARAASGAERRSNSEATSKLSTSSTPPSRLATAARGTGAGTESTMCNTSGTHATLSPSSPENLAAPTDVSEGDGMAQWIAKMATKGAESSGQATTEKETRVAAVGETGLSTPKNPSPNVDDEDDNTPEPFADVLHEEPNMRTPQRGMNRSAALVALSASIASLEGFSTPMATAAALASNSHTAFSTPGSRRNSVSIGVPTPLSNQINAPLTALSGHVMRVGPTAAIAMSSSSNGTGAGAQGWSTPPLIGDPRVAASTQPSPLAVSPQQRPPLLLVPVALHSPPMLPPQPPKFSSVNSRQASHGSVGDENKAMLEQTSSAASAAESHTSSTDDASTRSQRAWSREDNEEDDGSAASEEEDGGGAVTQNQQREAAKEKATEPAISLEADAHPKVVLEQAEPLSKMSSTDITGEDASGDTPGRNATQAAARTGTHSEAVLSLHNDVTPVPSPSIKSTVVLRPVVTAAAAAPSSGDRRTSFMPVLPGAPTDGVDDGAAAYPSIASRMSLQYAPQPPLGAIPQNAPYGDPTGANNGTRPPAPQLAAGTAYAPHINIYNDPQRVSERPSTPVAGMRRAGGGNGVGGVYTGAAPGSVPAGVETAQRVAEEDRNNGESGMMMDATETGGMEPHRNRVALGGGGGKAQPPMRGTQQQQQRNGAAAGGEGKVKQLAHQNRSRRARTRSPQPSFDPPHHHSHYYHQQHPSQRQDHQKRLRAPRAASSQPSALTLLYAALQPQQQQAQPQPQPQQQHQPLLLKQQGSPASHPVVALKPTRLRTLAANGNAMLTAAAANEGAATDSYPLLTPGQLDRAWPRRQQKECMLLVSRLLAANMEYRASGTSNNSKQVERNGEAAEPVGAERTANEELWASAEQVSRVPQDGGPNATKPDGVHTEVEETLQSPHHPGIIIVLRQRRVRDQAKNKRDEANDAENDRVGGEKRIQDTVAREDHKSQEQQQQLMMMNTLKDQIQSLPVRW